MISSSKIKYLVRKHPSLRFALVALFFLFIIMLLSLFSIQIHRAPVIKEINPSVGKPGDIIDITGKHFGKIRESSYVEFNGTRLTSSSYISWTDNEIKVLIPPNIQDGLVVVGSHNLRSKPAFFANEKDIPVLARQRQQSAVPFISEISKTTVSPGELLTIYGNNFGFQADDTSLVYFSSDRESLLQNVSSSPQAKKVSHIPASISDLDYEYWSDTEIRVFVPDGATSGNLYIETHYGKSGEHEITVSSKVGTKTFATQRTYVLQVVSDIDNISTKEAATIRFFVPRPVTSATQPVVELLECAPEPAISNYENTIVHQMQITRSAPKKQFSQNFVVSASEIKTQINANAVRSYNNMNQLLFANATKEDKCVPAGNTAVSNLSQIVVGSESNPYKKARLIYDYMIERFSITEAKSSNAKNDVLDLIKKRRGDAYDFTILYTALLRSQGIPCIPLSGILIEKSLQTKVHWWCEFFIPDVGWIPVDIALGKGLQYQKWTNIEDVKEYYFGNLDAQHVAFSRGWNEIKPTSESAIIVQQPRSYALQSIWEEASQETLKYNSNWSVPVVLAIY